MFLKYKYVASVSDMLTTVHKHTMLPVALRFFYSLIMDISSKHLIDIRSVCVLYKIITNQYSYHKIICYIYEYYWLNKLLPCWNDYCHVLSSVTEVSSHNLAETCTCVGLLKITCMQSIKADPQCFFYSRKVKGRSWRKK